MGNSELFDILRVSAVTHSARCRIDLSKAIINSIQESRRDRALSQLTALIVSLVWGLFVPLEPGIRAATTIVLYLCLAVGLTILLQSGANERYRRARQESVVKRISHTLKLNEELREITGPGTSL